MDLATARSLGFVTPEVRTAHAESLLPKPVRLRAVERRKLEKAILKAMKRTLEPGHQVIRDFDEARRRFSDEQMLNIAKAHGVDQPCR